MKDLIDSFSDYNANKVFILLIILLLEAENE